MHDASSALGTPAARLSACPRTAGRQHSSRSPVVAPLRLPALTCRATGPGEQQPQQGDSSPEGPSTSDGGSVREALQAAQQQQQQPGGGGGGKRQAAAGSTDWMATQLTRRFGLAGGLAWVGFLTFGVVGEQVKTRLEVASEEANTREVSADTAAAREVVAPNGLRYSDLKIGGGSPPQPGYLVILDYKAYADGSLFEDTTAPGGKPIVFLYGKRPLSGGMCVGTEQALATMRAGGRRRVTVPPELGFGAGGATLRPTEHVPEKSGLVPPNATLVYELSLLRVSIAPS